ncbi:MAG: hypothetical protein M0Q40_01435 [Limnochordia bacterium]|jgi:hypothetical protein|nr:hypothetical protein [Limnochordia bacterium]
MIEENARQDQLFRQLLITYFAEFTELFFPDAAPHMDRSNYEPIELVPPKGSKSV